MNIKNKIEKYLYTKGDTATLFYKDDKAMLKSATLSLVIGTDLLKNDDRGYSVYGQSGKTSIKAYSNYFGILPNRADYIL